MQLLKDFIIVKLYKAEESQWRDLGYDIANFTVPKAGQIKSNFLQSAEPEVKPGEDSEASTTVATTEEGKEAGEPEKTPEQMEEERQ